MVVSLFNANTFGSSAGASDQYTSSQSTTQKLEPTEYFASNEATWFLLCWEPWAASKSCARWGTEIAKPGSCPSSVPGPWSCLPRANRSGALALGLPRWLPSRPHHLVFPLGAPKETWGRERVGGFPELGVPGLTTSRRLKCSLQECLLSLCWGVRGKRGHSCTSGTQPLVKWIL